MITLRLRVWGLVQGVGFRFYTKRLADQLQINGMVKNKIDASVEIIVQDTPERAYAFVDRVKTSPPSPYAKIRSSTLEIIENEPIYKDSPFIINDKNKRERATYD